MIIILFRIHPLWSTYTQTRGVSGTRNHLDNFWQSSFQKVYYAYRRSRGSTGSTKYTILDNRGRNV